MDIVHFSKGEKVIYDNKEVIITKVNTLDTVTIEEISSGISHQVHVSSLKPIFNKKEKLSSFDIIFFWEIASCWNRQIAIF